MKVIPTTIKEVILIEPDIHRDGRGFFFESYRKDRYTPFGVAPAFVQDNHSSSQRGTLRGLHAQLRKPQGKLIRVVRGQIFDVAVDIRRGSPTYRQWVGMELSAENFRQCYIPPGFAHGFYTLSETAEMEYKCTDYYDPGGELRLLWNDPEIGIAWPEGDRLLSEQDRAGKRFKDLEASFPAYMPGAAQSNNC